MGEITLSEKSVTEWRKVAVHPQRTKIDWAFEMEELRRTQYADAEKVILICDHMKPLFSFVEPLSPQRVYRTSSYFFTESIGQVLGVH